MACGTTCVVNGEYDGFLREELRKRVYGNVGRKRGSILDLVERALENDVRIDASAWAQQYALPVAATRIRGFIETVLEQADADGSESECA
jgi:hypothetical protein